MDELFDYLEQRNEELQEFTSEEKEIVDEPEKTESQQKKQEGLPQE